MQSYRIIPLLSLSCLLIAAGARADTYIRDNTLHSSTLALTVTVSPSFRYLGELEYRVAMPAPDGGKEISQETRSYVFIDAEGDRLKRIVYLLIRPELSPLQANLVGQLIGDLEFGVCDLADTDYQCATRLISSGGTEPLAHYIHEEGYLVPPCLLEKSFARLERAEGRYLTILFYLEDTSSAVLNCQTWKDESHLTKQQRKYLNHFDLRCLDAFDLYSTKPVD
jgi:hypothetical protein